MTVDAEIILIQVGRDYGSRRRIEARWRGGRIAAINRDLSKLELFNYGFIKQEKAGEIWFLQTLLIIVDQDQTNFYVMRDSLKARAYRACRYVLKGVVRFSRWHPRLFRWLHQRFVLPQFNLP